MNSYYHEFQAGFNFWMIFVAVMCGVMVLLGWKQYRRSRRQAIQVFSDDLLLKIALVAAIVFSIWLIIESGDGIIQMLDNGLSGDEYAWQSVAGMPFVAAVAGGIFAAALYAIGKVTGLAKLGHLHKELEGWQCEQSRKEAKRLTARQGERYRMVGPTYMRSVTVMQMVEHHGNQTRRARVICDQDWAQLQPQVQTRPRMRR